MSIMTRVRGSAGATLEQGKSAVGIASSRVRTLPANTLNGTRTAAVGVGRQAYATLGAGDAIVAIVTRQREEFPEQARQNAAKLAEVIKSRVNAATEFTARTQETIASMAEGVAGRSVNVVTSVRKLTPAASAGRARDAYDKLAVRGEQVATDLRHDPVLVRIIRQADSRVENVANAVTSVAQKVRARVSAQATREAAATTSTPVRATPANKVPAHRTTVRETPADEAAVSTTPTHRAAAATTARRQAAAKAAAATRKAALEKAAATRRAAAKKAAATRRAAALEDAAKREAAAKKAAATRKKTAAAREQAADARHTAAVKAAATRKQNAANA